MVRTVALDLQCLDDLPGKVNFHRNLDKNLDSEGDPS